MIGWGYALIVPVRTNSLDNFAKDLFLPTTVNRILTIENLALKIFAGIFAFVLDIVTLPIRLFTSIPRAFNNSRLPEQPLLKYLKDHHVNERLISSDHVEVKLGWESLREGRQRQNWEQFNVHFIEVPVYERYNALTSGSSGPAW